MTISLRFVRSTESLVGIGLLAIFSGDCAQAQESAKETFYAQAQRAIVRLEYMKHDPEPLAARARKITVQLA